MPEPQTQAYVNQTLDRRRDERAAEQLMQEGISRITELTSSAMEIAQKNIAYTASVLRYYTDAIEAMQTSIGQVVERTQKVAEQTHRAATSSVGNK